MAGAGDWHKPSERPAASATLFSAPKAMHRGRTARNGSRRTEPDDYRAVLAAFRGADAGRCRGVIYLWALDEAIGEDSDVDILKAAQERACGGLLHLVQALARSNNHHARAAHRGHRRRPVGLG